MGSNVAFYGSSYDHCSGTNIFAGNFTAFAYDEHSLQFYLTFKGAFNANAAFAAQVARAYAAEVGPADIGITTGCNQAFAAAVMAAL